MINIDLKLFVLQENSEKIRRQIEKEKDRQIGGQKEDRKDRQKGRQKVGMRAFFSAKRD